MSSEESTAPIAVAPTAASDTNGTGTAAPSTDDGTRKRRSRWSEHKVTDTATATDASAAGGGEPKKRSRWGNDQSAATTTALVDPVTALQQQAYLVRVRLDAVNKQMMTVETDVAQINERDRSPSPPPTYDQNGIRTNTRPMRYRAKLMKERSDLMQQAMTLAPALQQAGGPLASLFAGLIGPGKQKWTEKLMIPEKEYPDYNFMGLIIGPRGNTQKRMEKETGCKIAIRGKGSVKPGKQRKDTRPQPGDDEPSHVWIEADTKDQLDKAVAIVKKLLVPVDESANLHKAKQLRELALINGTTKSEMTCRVCGAKGHVIKDCPERTGARWTHANVLCDICGSPGHIAADCTERVKKAGPQGPRDGTEPNIQAEYANFMAEITGQGQTTAAGIMIGTGMLLTDASKPGTSNDAPPPLPTSSPPSSSPAPIAPSSSPPPSAAAGGGGYGVAPAPPPRALAIMAQQQQAAPPPYGYHMPPHMAPPYGYPPMPMPGMGFSPYGMPPAGYPAAYPPQPVAPAAAAGPPGGPAPGHYVEPGIAPPPAPGYT